MPVYIHLLSFFVIMWMANVALLCQDYAMVRRLTLKNVYRNLVKTLYIMASRHWMFQYICIFVWIIDSHVHILSVVLSNESCNAYHFNFLSSAYICGRKHCACATALMCLRLFIHTNCTWVNMPRPFICITIRYISILSRGITYQSNILLLYRHILYDN